MAARTSSRGGFISIFNEAGLTYNCQAKMEMNAMKKRNQTMVTGSTTLTAIFRAIASNPQKKAVMAA